MPQLRLYGRAWKIADDDFVWPELIEGIARGFWLVVVVATTVISFEEVQHCPHAYKLLIYVAGASASGFLTTVIAFGTSWWSARGSVADGFTPERSPRRYLPLLLYARCPVLLFDVAWNIFGLVFLTYKKKDCKRRFVQSVHISVIGSWLVFFLFCVSIYVLSRRIAKKKHSDANQQVSQPISSVERCTTALFRCGGSQDALSAKPALTDVCSILNNVVAGEDLVFTDILAGLCLLNEAPDYQPTNVHKQLLPARPDLPAWMNLELASRYIDFAAGSYGWPHFTAAYGPKGWYYAYQQMKCPCRNPTTPPGEIVGDNCCFCNTAVMLYMTREYQPELVYFTLHNRIYEVPFFVFLDQHTQSIVVVIRGSLTFEDFVTGLDALAEEYVIPAGPANAHSYKIKGHKGFFEGAKYIVEQLLELKIIDRLLVDYPEYWLVTTGQSLGAGVAPCLTLYLAQHYGRERVRCFAFSPPGCLIASRYVPLTTHNICTVVVGDDMVSHMSLVSLAKIRTDILDALKVCEAAKYEILRLGCTQLCHKAKPRRVRESEKAASVRREQQPSIAMKLLSNVEDGAEQLLKTASADENVLCLPGSIMYVTDTGDDNEHRLWKVSWEMPDNFHHLILTKSVVDHHFPFTVAKVLKEAAHQTQLS